MSQDRVERVIGRLVTDEGFRRRFASDPAAALEPVSAGLTECERRALLALEPWRVALLAEALDPRLLKIDLPGEP